MKRILNKCIYLKDKLLCWLGWHDYYPKIYWFFYLEIPHDAKCIHCGARKND